MKFLEDLKKSNKQIKAARAEIIADEAKSAMLKEVMSLEEEVRSLKRQKMNLEDLSPDSSMSLNPVKGDFNAGKWAKELIQVRLAIVLAEQKLKASKKTYDEYFESISK